MWSPAGDICYHWCAWKIGQCQHITLYITNIFGAFAVSYVLWMKTPDVRLVLYEHVMKVTIIEGLLTSIWQSIWAFWSIHKNALLGHRRTRRLHYQPWKQQQPTWSILEHEQQWAERCWTVRVRKDKLSMVFTHQAAESWCTCIPTDLTKTLSFSEPVTSNLTVTAKQNLTGAHLCWTVLHINHTAVAHGSHIWDESKPTITKIMNTFHENLNIFLVGLNHFPNCRGLTQAPYSLQEPIHCTRNRSLQHLKRAFKADHQRP